MQSVIDTVKGPGAHYSHVLDFHTFFCEKSMIDQWVRYMYMWTQKPELKPRPASRTSPDT